MRLVSEMTGRIRVVTIGSPARVENLGAWLAAVADDITIVSGTGSPARGLDEVIEHLPDIVLVNFEPHAVETYDLVHSLLTRFPAIRVVVLTTFGTGETLWRLLRIGVKAVLPRDPRPEDLIVALRAVQAGHTVVGAYASTSLFGNSIARTPLRRPEVQILSLLAQGLSYDDITARLAISRSTLKRYLRDIETKLKAKNRVEAVANAIKEGLI